MKTVPPILAPKSVRLGGSLDTRKSCYRIFAPHVRDDSHFPVPVKKLTQYIGAEESCHPSHKGNILSMMLQRICPRNNLRQLACKVSSILRICVVFNLVGAEISPCIKSQSRGILGAVNLLGKCPQSLCPENGAHRNID